MSSSLVAGLPSDGEVLHALLRRRAEGRLGSRADVPPRDRADRPRRGRGDGRFDDGCRVALVVAGGGMRGAYSGGMVHALEDAGLGQAFDVVYGSSAGAFVGAAMLVGDGRGAAHIFFEEMACRAFADPRRAGRAPIVSLDHLFGEILGTSRQMSWERLVGAPLRVVATAVDDLTAHVLTPRTAAEWQLAMRATATIPVVAGRPVELHGRRWIDGSVAEPLPVLRAIRDGATHVLALLNRTVPELRRADPGAGPARWARALDRFAPGLGSMAQEGSRHGPVLALLDDAGHPDRAGAHLLVVAPDTDEGVRSLTTDPARVERAAEAGYAAMTGALDAAAAVPGAC